MAQIIVPENLALKKLFQKIIKDPPNADFYKEKITKKVKDSALGYITKLDENSLHITPRYKADQNTQLIPVKTITKTGIPLPFFPKNIHTNFQKKVPILVERAPYFSQLWPHQLIRPLINRT